jgi:DNA anti-recombination protein RmuC
MEIPAGLWIALILLEALLFIVFIGAAVLLFRQIEQALVSLARLERDLGSASGKLDDINQKLGGTRKGRVGENILREQLNSLIAVGYVEQNVSLGGGTVEFAVKLPGGCFVPLDSKFVKTGWEKSANEITKYIHDPRTLGFGIMAVPDEAHGSVLSAIGKIGKDHQIVVVPYTQVGAFVLSLYLIAERLALSARPIKTQSKIGYVLSQFSKAIEKLSDTKEHIRRKLDDFDRQIETLEESYRDLDSLLKKGSECPPEVGGAQEGAAQEGAE